MVKEAAIAGEGFQFGVRVLGYERPGEESGTDANWLLGEVELTASGPGFFTGSQSVSLRTEELASFRDQLAQLVQRLEGEATLQHMEDELGCTITLEKGRGSFTGFVQQHIGAELRVTDMPTDQSYIQRSLREFDAIVREFPVKGDPLG